MPTVLTQSSSRAAVVAEFQLPTTPEAKVLQHVRALGRCDRRELQRALGFSQPSITRYLSRLMDRGLLEEKGVTAEDRAGRPRKLLTTVAGTAVSWGVHIGVKSAELVVVDGAGTILEHETAPLRVQGVSPEEYVEALKFRLQALGAERGNPAFIGVATSAFVDRDGVVSSTAFGWDRVNIGKILTGVFDQDVVLATGVAAMAGRELAYEPLGDAVPRSTFYFYARNVLAHAWLFHGAVHRSHTHRAPDFLSNSSRPLTVAAVISVARDLGHDVSTLPDVLAIGRRDVQLQQILQERGEAIAEVIGTAVDVVGPQAVVLSGEAFTLDRELTVQVSRLLKARFPTVDLALSGNNALISAAAYMAVSQLWAHPVD